MSAVPPPAEIEAYLRKHIPISAALGVRVLACEAGGATLAAPLAPNLNHRATVFGGSASVLAILAAWTWLHFALRAAGQSARLVIQRNTVDYLAPIAGDFEARCEAPAPGAMEQLRRTLARHGKGRIELTASLTCAGKKVAAFTGEYVALALRPTAGAGR